MTINLPFTSCHRLLEERERGRANDYFTYYIMLIKDCLGAQSHACCHYKMIDNFQQSNALKSKVVFYEYQGFSATLRPLGVASNSGARKNWRNQCK